MCPPFALSPSSARVREQNKNEDARVCCEQGGCSTSEMTCLNDPQNWRHGALEEWFFQHGRQCIAQSCVCGCCEYTPDNWLLSLSPSFASLLSTWWWWKTCWKISSWENIFFSLATRWGTRRVCSPWRLAQALYISKLQIQTCFIEDTHSCIWAQQHQAKMSVRSLPRTSGWLNCNYLK